MEVAWAASPACSAAATIQSVRTPPPWPPSAAMRIESGRGAGDVMTEGTSGRLEPADHPCPHCGEGALPGARIADHARLVERGAEHGGVRDLAAEAAADAALVDPRDGIVAERVATFAERQRGAPIQAHAGLVPR